MPFSATSVRHNNGRSTLTPLHSMDNKRCVQMIWCVQSWNVWPVGPLAHCAKQNHIEENLSKCYIELKTG